MFAKLWVWVVSIAVAMSFSTSNGFAGENLLSSVYKTCIDDHATDSDWSVCSNEEIARQEAGLTNAWAFAKRLAQELSDQTYQSLLTEQRLWTKWKDAACGFYA